MVFLPECFDYVAESSEQACSMAAPLQSPRMQCMCDLAQELGVWLSLGGYHEQVFVFGIWVQLFYIIRVCHICKPVLMCLVDATHLAYFCACLYIYIYMCLCGYVNVYVYLYVKENVTKSYTRWDKCIEHSVPSQVE